MPTKIVNENGYTFQVKETGTTTVKGEVQNATAKRDGYLQTQAGGTLREATHQGGHLVAAQANGPAIKENIFAQDAKLNQGAYKSVENAEQRLLKDNANIQTERTAYVSAQKNATGSIPDAFLINDRITYADGQTQEVHLSFANLTRTEQEGLNQELNAHADMLDELPNPGDELRNSMSTAEYSNLMEETDAGLSSVRNEFEEQTSITTTIEPEGGEANMGWGENDADIAGTETDVAGAEANVDDGADLSMDD